MLKHLLVTRFHDIESHFKFDSFVILLASASGRLLSLYGNERIIETFEKLEIQDSFFRSTFERADQCLLPVDRAGEILDVNLCGQKMLGVFERGAARKNFRELAVDGGTVSENPLQGGSDE